MEQKNQNNLYNYPPVTDILIELLNPILKSLRRAAERNQPKSSISAAQTESTHMEPSSAGCLDFICTF